MPRLKLHGFNNLTKSLSFNIYDVCYARTGAATANTSSTSTRIYNAERLTEILDRRRGHHRRHDAERGAPGLRSAGRQRDHADRRSTARYRAAGTGAEAKGRSRLRWWRTSTRATSPCTPIRRRHPDNGISTFRADIDVSTCGKISPLKALNYLIAQLRVGHRDHRLPRARLHSRREGPQALHRPQDQLDPEFRGQEHQGALRNDRRQRLPGEHVPHQDAEGFQPRHLPVRGKRRRTCPSRNG